MLVTCQRRTHKKIIVYTVMALLFLAFFDVHIHNHEGAVEADHGSAVSISSLENTFLPDGSSDEINVSPDGMLKVKPASVDFTVVFLLVVIMTVLCLTFIGRIREDHIELPVIHSHVIPPLRAPPL